MSITDIPIFVVHHNKLVERKLILLEQLSKHKINAIWIEDFLPETLYIDPSEKYINKNEYSLFLKSKKALELGVANNNPFFIVFEDDVVIPDDFNTIFSNFISQFIKVDGDLLMIGNCCDIGIPGLAITPDNNNCIFWQPGFTTRCTHAILYTKKGAEKIIPNLISPFKGYDHKLNDIITRENLKSYYLYPGIEQLTQSLDPIIRQRFKSTVQP